MLGNAEFVVLLQQKNSEIKPIVDLFELSPSQEMYLKTGEKGTGLVICGKKVIPFSKKIPKCLLYNIMSTNFKEKQQQKDEIRDVNLKISADVYESLKGMAYKREMTLEEYIVSCCRKGVYE